MRGEGKLRRIREDFLTVLREMGEWALGMEWAIVGHWSAKSTKSAKFFI